MGLEQMSWLRQEIRKLVRSFKRSQKRKSARRPYSLTRRPNHSLGIEPLESRVLLSGSLGIGEWANEIGGTGTDSTAAVVVDANDNTYVVGQFENTFDIDPGAGTTTLTSNGGTDFFVAKYDTDGNLVWGHGIGGTDNEAAFGVDVDAAGNVYVTGTFGETDGSGLDFDPSGAVAQVNGQGAFVQKFDTNGNHQWVQSFNAPNVDNSVRPRDITIAPNGNVVTVGDFTEVFTSDFDPTAGTADLDFEGGIGDRNGYFSIFDTNGNFVDARSVGGSSSSIQSVSFDAAGNMFIVGVGENVDLDLTAAETRVSGLFIACYAPNLNLDWSQSFGTSTNMMPEAIIADALGNVYITGAFDSSGGQVDFDPGAGTTLLGSGAAETDAFFGKYSAADGSFIWAFGVDGGPTVGNTGYDIAIGPDGDIFFTGELRTQQATNPDLDPGTGVFTLQGNGLEDAFILRMNPDGSFDDAFVVGGAGTDTAKGIGIDSDGDAIIGGLFNGTADFDPSAGTLELTTPNGNPDGFVNKITLSDPNEANGSISGIKFNDANQNGIQDAGEAALAGWTIFIDADDSGTLNGAEVSQVTDANGAYTFSNLAPGTYNVQEVIQLGWTPVLPANGEQDVQVVAGITTDLDFANFQTFETGSISGVKFFDHDQDGVQDAGDEGLQGWTVFIDVDGSDTFNAGDISTITAADGSYTFAGLAPGDYVIREVLQTDWTQTAPAGGEHAVTLVSGQDVAGRDFGNFSQLEVSFNETGDLTNDNTPSISGTITDPTALLDVNTATVTVTLFDLETGADISGPFNANVNVGATVTWDHTFAAPIADGTVGVRIEVALVSGVDSSVSGQLTIDTLGPTVASITPGNNSSTTVPQTVTVVYADASAIDQASATDEANYVLTFLGADGVVGGGDDVVIADWIDSIAFDADTKTATLTTLPANIVPVDGVFTITIKGTATVTDVAGNALDGDGDTTPGDDHVVTITVDSTAPAGTVTAQTTNNNSPTVAGTVDDTTATVQISLTNSNTGEVFNNGGNLFDAVVVGNNWTVDLSALATPVVLPDGQYDVSVTYTDPQGNTRVTATNTILNVVDDFDFAGDDDDTAANADAIPTDGTVQTHSLHSPGDMDFVTFNVAAQQTLNITVIPAANETVTVTLFGPDNPATQVATQTVAGQARITQDLAPGQYWVKVEGDAVNVVPEYTINVIQQPDLTVAVTGDDFDNAPVLGNDGNVNVQVNNLTGVDANGDVNVKVFLSTDNVLDANDVEIGEGTVALNALAAGQSTNGQIAVSLPADDGGNPATNLPAGQYFYFATVDTGNAVAETDETNNDSAAFARTIGAAQAQIGAQGAADLQADPDGSGFIVVSVTPTLVQLVDGDGTTFNVQFTGAGTFQAVDDANGGLDFILTGTNLTSSLIITALGGGNGVVNVDDIIVHDGSINQIVASTTDVAGDILVSDGTIRNLSIRDITDDHLIDIGGTVFDAVRITLRDAVDTTITSASRIASLRAQSITRSGGSATDFNITAPALFQLFVTNAFENDLIINQAGTVAGTVVQFAMLGNLTNADWNITGDMGFLMVQGQTDVFTLTMQSTLGTAFLGQAGNVSINVDGVIGYLNATGWTQGQLTAAGIQTLFVFGNAGFDMTLTGTDALAFDLGVAYVLNGTLTGDWDITGTSSVILALGDVQNFNLTTTDSVNLLQMGLMTNSNVIIAGILQTAIWLGGWNGGSLAADAISTLISIGDFNADLLITGNQTIGGSSLLVASIIGQLGSGDDNNRVDWRLNGLVRTILATNINGLNIFDTVANLNISLLLSQQLMQNVTIRASLQLSTLIAGGMNNAGVFVGMVGGFNGIAPDRNSFANQTTAAITTLILTGAGLNGGPSFVNSAIAAWRLGFASLGLVEVNNGGTQFGVSTNLLTQLLATVNGASLSLINLDDSGDSTTDTDFVVQVVDE